MPGAVPLPPAGLIPDTCGYVIWSQPLSTKVPRLRWRGGSLVYAAQQYERYFVDLDMAYEAYLQKFSSKSRSTLRRKLRRFAELGDGTIDSRTYRTTDELREFFRLALPLSGVSYQERLFGKGLPNEESLRASILELASQDKVRGYLLFLQGEPIAYLLCPSLGGVLTYEWQGYDQRYAFLSPGTVLLMEVLQSLFTEKAFSLLDFTEGEGEHKQFFSTHSRLCADIFVLDARVWVVAAVLVHVLLSVAAEPARGLLRRIGLIGTFRRFLRA